MKDLKGSTLLGRYRVDEFLGKGGMADVYKVWDKQRATFLAMKVLHEDLAEDKVFLRRFRREAQTLAKLQHPNVVRSYGLEQTEDLAFILMDYVEGTTLRKEIALAKEPLSPKRVLEIMRLVCSALHYAHQSGIVHCDIKPANIMIHKNGTVLVSDFGIARMTEAATATMVGVGTPAYMAPEQARGEAPVAQTDIYSLGVVLFEMLTGGERPFTGEHARTSGSTSEKVRWEQIHTKPPSLKQYNSKIPLELETIVMRCMAKNPKSRYQSMQELLDDLQIAIIGKIEDASSQENIQLSLSPQPVEGSYIPSLVSRLTALFSSGLTKSWWLPVLAFVLIAGLIFGGFLLLSGQNDSQHPDTLIVSTFTTVPTKTLTPTITPTSTTTSTPTLAAGSIITSPKDSMKMVYVPEGAFLMGSPYSESGTKNNEKPQHTVFLNSYWIDQTEVTNAMYILCVQAGGCQPPYSTRSFTRLTYFSNTQFANYPVIYVKWSNAETYCEWAGRRLPSEAEWEKAARGTDGRTYPWGEGINCDLANYWGLNNGCVGDTSEVGNYPAGASIYGALDMAGNVWEWVSDWYQEIYYSSSPFSNPLGPATGEYKILRGGSWYNSEGSVRIAVRSEHNPDSASNNFGFRCASSFVP